MLRQLYTYIVRDIRVTHYTVPRTVQNTVHIGDVAQAYQWWPIFHKLDRQGRLGSLKQLRCHC
jgi:hypothetical protein